MREGGAHSADISRPARLSAGSSQSSLGTPGDKIAFPFFTLLQTSLPALVSHSTRSNSPTPTRPRNQVSHNVSSLLPSCRAKMNDPTEQGSARPRRSSRAVAKPDFRAMENYGDLTSEYGDDLFVARDPSPHHVPHHVRRPSGGMKKIGGGNVTKAVSRRPPVVDEMEQQAKKLEQDVAALQKRRLEVRGQLEAILRENETLRGELRVKKESGKIGGGAGGGGLLYF